MAFRNASAINDTANTNTLLLTCPTSYEAVVHALYIANNSPALGPIVIKVKVTRLHDSGTTVHILNGTQILYGTSLVFDKPINLRAGDEIIFQADVAFGAEVFASALLTAEETTPPGL